jgi:hypothetical protein
MRFLLLLCAAGLVFAQGTETKRKADEYEVHAQSKVGEIGGEYMVHSYSRGEQMFIAKDYLVVEVAIFPPKGTEYEVAHTDFVLRINGKQEVLHAVDPTMVAHDMEHPDYKTQREGPRVQATAGTNEGGVSVGGPPVNPNPFPGSQQPGTPRYPPVEIPRDNPSGVKKVPVNPTEVLMDTALVEGPHRGPTSGFLYFPYRRKMSAIKSLELIYADAVLKLK